MNETEIRATIAKYKFYHCIKLTDTITTPGAHASARPHEILMQQLQSADVKGKRVLDIGCRDGLYSFAAEKLGAAEVIGIDNDLSRPATEFLIPFFKSKVRMLSLNLYDLRPETHGQFDLVIFPGVLYHLRYPFWGLRAIREIMKPGGTLLVETAIYETQPHHALLFCPIGDDSPYEATSPTIFNEKGLVDSLTSLGFETTAVEYARSRRLLTGWRRRTVPRLQTMLRLGNLPQFKAIRCVFTARYVGFDEKSMVNRYWEGTHDFHTLFGGDRKP